MIKLFQQKTTYGEDYHYLFIICLEHRSSRSIGSTVKVFRGWNVWGNECNKIMEVT